MNTEQEKRVLNEPGVETLMAEIATTIRQEFATAQAELISKLYAETGMMYLFHEDNVQAISQYGINDKTYVFGDSSTEDTSMDRPKNALYYLDPQGESTINGVQVTFVTTEDGEYIPTEPNDQGQEFQAEYHDYITYLG